MQAGHHRVPVNRIKIGFPEETERLTASAYPCTQLSSARLGEEEVTGDSEAVRRGVVKEKARPKLLLINMLIYLPYFINSNFNEVILECGQSARQSG